MVKNYTIKCRLLNGHSGYACPETLFRVESSLLDLDIARERVYLLTIIQGHMYKFRSQPLGTPTLSGHS